MPTVRTAGLVALRARATEFVWFAASTGAFQATRLIVSLVAAAAMPPSEFATWSLVLIGLNYATYLNGGLLSGANREIPILLGSGEQSRADHTESIANGMMSLLAGAVAGGAVLAAGIMGNWVVLGVGLTIAIQQVYLLQQVALKSRLQFNRASAQQAVLALAFPAVSLALLRSLGVGALIVGQGTAFLCASVLVAAKWPPKSGILAWSPSLGLAMRGFPIMVAGLLFAALSTTDRWLVLTLYGHAALGTYTVASILSSALLFIALLVAQQSYPRLAMNVGKALGAKVLIRQAALQSAIAAGLALPVSLLVVVAAPMVIPRYLPGYASSVPAVQILAVGMLALIAATGFTNLRVATGRSWLYVVLIGVSIGFQAAVAGVARFLGFGVEGVAIGASLSYICLLVLSLIAIRAAR